MLKKILLIVCLVLSAIILYFIFWPVPIEPVAWEAPPNSGYTGAFEKNERLKGIEVFPIGDNTGPEDIALDAQGRIYCTTHEGRIVRLNPDGSNPQNWVDTNGRPLGIDFDQKGNLIVADAYRGLLSVSPSGTVRELVTQVDGIPVRFADDVDVAADGKIYFSDASTKFGAKQSAGTYQASLLDLMEHGGHGRLLVYDPVAGTATTLLDGLNFANGVAVSHDKKYILFNETGSYRVIRYWIAGPSKGKYETVIQALPSFPDNISTGLNGRYWIALVSPRNALVDKLSARPFLRKVIQRLPAFLRPKAVAYGHIFAMDQDGTILANFQDPTGKYPLNTSVTETKEYLYIGSLVTPVLGRIHKDALGL